MSRDPFDILKEYESEATPLLGPEGVKFLQEFITRQISTLAPEQINNHYAPLVKNFKEFYSNMYPAVKIEVTKRMQWRYESLLEQYQDRLEKYNQKIEQIRRTVNTQEEFDQQVQSRGLIEPREPILPDVTEDVIFTNILSKYEDINNVFINKFFNTVDESPGSFYNAYIDWGYSNVNILHSVYKNQTVYDYILEKMPKNDDDYTWYYSYIVFLAKVAIPNIITELIYIMQQKNAIWNYFDFLNVNLPQVQSRLGIMSLTWENFEAGASILSLNDNIIDSYSLNDGRKAGWRRLDLMQAIFNSGLNVPNPRVKFVQQYQGLSPANKMEYTVALVSKNNRLHTHAYEYESLVKMKMLYSTNAITYQSIGIDRPGTIAINMSTTKSTLEAIYRRMYGTIYTINWNVMCQSGKIQVIELYILNIILRNYFSGRQVENYQEACTILDSKMPLINQIRNQYGGNLQSWLQFVRNNYTNPII